MIRILLFFIGLSLASISFAHVMMSEWTPYIHEKYGFAMLAPVHMQMDETDIGDGWVELTANLKGIEFIALVKMDSQATQAEIETYGERLTAISTDVWLLVDEGETAGWTWFRVVSASMDNNAIIGVYGVGPKGSYFVLAKTTDEDFRVHLAAYQHWSESIRIE